MFGLGKKEQSARDESAPSNPGELSGDNTVKEWLDHPAGGVIFREKLAEAGQKESVLRMVWKVPFKRLVAMSNGRFTEEMMNQMITDANSSKPPEDTREQTETTGNDEPVVEESPTESVTVSLPKWEEKITPDRFAGKTVVITGAGSGIGRATASRVAREGGRVIAVDISKERLQEFKSDHKDYEIKTVAGDITDEKAINRIVKAAGDEIHALANVAGIMDNFTPLHEVSDEIWERVMNVNLVGMMKLTRAVLPKMLSSNYGNIVNVGSEASLKASAAGVAYTTSKHAVLGLTKSLAFMYGPSGLRSNLVAPGGVLTNIQANFESDLGEERANLIIATAPDAAEANQLAAAITFLLSDDSTNINGAVLTSDGGWSVQ